MMEISISSAHSTTLSNNKYVVLGYKNKWNCAAVALVDRILDAVTAKNRRRLEINNFPVRVFLNSGYPVEQISKISSKMAGRDAASNQLIDYKNSQTVSVLVCERERAQLHVCACVCRQENKKTRKAKKTKREGRSIVRNEINKKQDNFSNDCYEPVLSINSINY